MFFQRKRKTIGSENGLNTISTSDLFNCIERNDYEKFKELLAASSNPNIQDQNGWTLLMWACRVKNKSIAFLLLSEGANPNVIVEGHSALSEAITCGGEIEIVQALLANNANLAKAEKAYVESTKFSLLSMIQYTDNELNEKMIDLLMQKGISPLKDQFPVENNSNLLVAF